ncbi:MAG: hypothetical protein AB9866_05910 [Syntrophobacteraceae bacterium]
MSNEHARTGNGQQGKASAGIEQSPVYMDGHLEPSHYVNEATLSLPSSTPMAATSVKLLT